MTYVLGSEDTNMQTSMNKSDRDRVDRRIRVEKLLDAAFRELQHDTGPQDIEYVAQRKSLKAEFNRILRPNTRIDLK